MYKGIWLKVGLVLLFWLVAFAGISQCSICAKTTEQLGGKAGEGFNTGIIYLMLTPFAIGGYVAWRWWKQEKAQNQENK